VAAVSYSWSVGQTLEQVTTGTNAPSGGSGTVEIRIDQTAGTVTDGNFAGSTRPVSKKDVWDALVLFMQYLERDTNIFQQ
jgi:hypothetical protein